jgi:crossover junction endodeoxyribonuclease RuvC
MVKSNQPTGERIILGIDPGTRIMGYGVLRVLSNKAELIALGVIDIHQTKDPYLRLGHIFKRMIGLIDSYLPDELSIEAPFYGKNVQSMLKLGRAQGVAIAAAITRDIPISEYEPKKIKMAITGNGNASKEQVAGMLQHLLHIPDSDMHQQLDATDALGAAYCHFLQMSVPQSDSHFKSWKDFINRNSSKIHSPSKS